jgi:hypothetical protein
MRHYNTEHSQHFYPRPCCVYLVDYFEFINSYPVLYIRAAKFQVFFGTNIYLNWLRRSSYQRALRLASGEARFHEKNITMVMRFAGSHEMALLYLATPSLQPS